LTECSLFPTAARSVQVAPAAEFCLVPALVVVSDPVVLPFLVAPDPEQEAECEEDSKTG